MKNRLYKYYPEDFGELTVDVLHMDLVFDVYDDRTNVKSMLRVRTKDAPIEKLELNCRDLEIRAVSCIQCEVSYRYRKDDAILADQQSIFLRGCTMTRRRQGPLHSRSRSASSGGSRGLCRALMI